MITPANLIKKPYRVYKGAMLEILPITDKAAGIIQHGPAMILARIVGGLGSQHLAPMVSEVAAVKDFRKEVKKKARLMARRVKN